MFLAPQHTQTVLQTHCLHLLLGLSIVPSEMLTMRMQNFLRVLGAKKHENKVYYGKCGNDEFVCLFLLFVQNHEFMYK